MVKAQRVTTMKDNTTFCRPSEGYENFIEVDLDNYVEVCTVQGELPHSDEKFPKGAPIEHYIKFGDTIFKKKSP